MSNAPFGFSVEEVRTWASQLAAESRAPFYFSEYYVCPREILQVERLLDDTRAAVVGIVGVQGVGKTSALQVLRRRCLDKTDGRADPPDLSKKVALFKWRRRTVLFESLLNGTHELSEEFRERYAWYLLQELRRGLPRVLDLPQSAVGLDVAEAEEALGKSVALGLREMAWLQVLLCRSVILIDMPDYSKSDRRLMTSDLNEIYWFWDRLAAHNIAPNVVIAVQKEMFRDHFFFDKMHKIELKPLKPEQMVEAYERRFGTLNPFTAEALAALARMSRGVFRRYLRYISMAIEHWEGQPTRSESIEASLVKEVFRSNA